jgi:hypothetical protein
MEIYEPGCISKDVFELGLKKKETSGQVVAKGDMTSREYHQPHSHQDSEKSQAMEQTGYLCQSNVLPTNVDDHASVDFVEINSNLRHTQQKSRQNSDPVVVADGTKENPVAQDSFIQPFKQDKPSKPIGDHRVAHEPKYSELAEPGLSKSNPEEIEPDIMEMTRFSQQLKNCDTVLVDDVKMVIPNLRVEDKKYRKILKPRYPRSRRMLKRCRPVGTPSNTEIIDTTDGQIRISLVTPMGSPGVLIPQYTWLNNSVTMAKDTS